MAENTLVPTFYNDFEPLTKMPSGRLQDILDKLNNQRVETGGTTVLNLDATLPTDPTICVNVLKTLLYKIPITITTLSLRFNPVIGHSSLFEVLIDYILNNNFLQTLYIMSSGISENDRNKLEDAWRKHLVSHRTDNMGWTFVRITVEMANAEEEDD